MEKISIPEKATKVAVIVRHSKSVQGGKNSTRTLKPEAIELCKAVEDEYCGLIILLMRHFGKGEFRHSPLPRALLTLWEMLHPTQMIKEPLLDLIISLKKINDGAWIEDQKKAGKAVMQILKEVALLNDKDQRKLFKNQAFNLAMKSFREAATNHGTDAAFTFSTTHEPAATIFMARENLIEEDELGLKECQSYVVFSDDAGQILSAVKFAPEATL